MREHFEITRHLLRPRNFFGYAAAVLKDFFHIPEKQLSDEEHLRACIDWLLLSAEVARGNGFSASYALKHGWDEAYPETTGYIIPTLLNALSAGHRGDEIKKTCLACGEWLLRIQNQNGSWNGHKLSEPYVFDTGQIIFGLLALHEHFKDQRYLVAAERAARWLIAEQEEDGAWVRHAYRKTPHAYYARVAWALALLWKATGKNEYRASAEKNFGWVVKQQQPDGWFNHSGFYEDTPAVLHTIAYTLEGLLGGVKIFGDESYLNAARRAADKLSALSGKKPLCGHYEKGWRPAKGGACLTGIAQMGIAWRKLHTMTGDESYLRAAERAVRYLKTRHRAISGIPKALAGSDPVWGKYLAYLYPNWAQKFFADALLEAMEYKRRFEG